MNVVLLVGSSNPPKSQSHKVGTTTVTFCVIVQLWPVHAVPRCFERLCDKAHTTEVYTFLTYACESNSSAGYCVCFFII